MRYPGLSEWARLITYRQIQLDKLKNDFIAIASHEDPQVDVIADDVIRVPHVPEILQPIVTVVPLQLLSYHIALLRGCDVDKPRNLAKSVTVE